MLSNSISQKIRKSQKSQMELHSQKGITVPQNLRTFKTPEEVLNLPTVDHSKFIDGSFMSDKIPIGQKLPERILENEDHEIQNGIGKMQREVSGNVEVVEFQGDKGIDLKDILHSPVRYEGMGSAKEETGLAKDISIPQPVESHYPSITSNMPVEQRKMLGGDHRGIGSHQNIGRVYFNSFIVISILIFLISNFLFIISEKIFIVIF